MYPQIPIAYAAVALVLMALAVIVMRTYAKAHSTRTLAEFVAGSDVRITGSKKRA